MARKYFFNAFFFTPSGFEKCSLLVDGDVIDAVIPAGKDPPAEALSATADLGGRFVIPGFVDAHFHLLSLALKGLRCDLSAAACAQEVADTMAQWAKNDAEAETVVGVEWDQSGWENDIVPTREMLDDAVPDRPAFARRICGHVGVVNTAFLGLLRGYEGFIDRNTGFITEDAAVEATTLSYPPEPAVAAAMEGAIGVLHRLGITTIHDIVEVKNFDAYLEGIRSSGLPLRIDALFHVRPGEFDRLKERSSGIDDKFFRPVGVKIYTDGSLGGRTAALNSPYADDFTIGDFLVSEEDLAARLELCLEKGITCAVHAIGDRALRTVLLEMLKFPSYADTFRIEHAEVVGWDEMEMLKRAPVYLVLQPNFVRNWQGPGGLYEKRLGHNRRERCNPFLSFLSKGIPYAFGSDGMPPGPLYGLKGATEHPTITQRISMAEAIRRYTEAAGQLGCFPRRIGRFERGYLADMAVLSGNPLKEDVDTLVVERTYLGGELVFQKEGC